MTFLETLGRVKAYVIDHGRVSLRVLGLALGLHDEQLEAVIAAAAVLAELS